MTKEVFTDVVMVVGVSDENAESTWMEGDNLLCQTLKGKFKRRK